MVKIPEGYRSGECKMVDGVMVPHDRIAPTTLEREGKRVKFKTQKELDKAWARGYHTAGRPETADKKTVQNMRDELSGLLESEDDILAGLMEALDQKSLPRENEDIEALYAEYQDRNK